MEADGSAEELSEYVESVTGSVVAVLLVTNGEEGGKKEVHTMARKRFCLEL